MTIHSAKYANAQHSAVTLDTVESAAVSLDLNPGIEDRSGWPEAFNAWVAAGNTPEAYESPE